MVEREPPRHADERLDAAGLRAALLLEGLLSGLDRDALRERFAPYRAQAALLRDAQGESLRRCAVAVRSALGPGDGLADYADPERVGELRESLDEVLRILNRRAALRGRGADRG